MTDWQALIRAAMSDECEKRGTDASLQFKLAGSDFRRLCADVAGVEVDIPPDARAQVRVYHPGLGKHAYVNQWRPDAENG